MTARRLELMSTSDPSLASDPKAKIGLALAGGGFRAALFHLGVLRRLAELDYLPRISALSCVSGGSLVGAVYCLLLEGLLKTTSTPTRNDYEALIDRCIEIVSRAAQANLRTRLFLN